MWFPETRAAWRRLCENYQQLSEEDRAAVRLLYVRGLQRLLGAATLSAGVGLALGPTAFIIVVGGALWIEGTME